MNKRRVNGLELVVPADFFGEWKDSEEYRKTYPPKMVEAGLVDRLMLLRYRRDATWKTPERRYQCLALRECEDTGRAPQSAITYLSKDEVRRGICPELLVLLDIRVDQLEVHHDDDDDGEVHVKVIDMKCLDCGGLFSTYLGDSYLCAKCHGPSSRFSSK